MYFLPLNLRKIDIINPNWTRPADVVKLRGSEYLTEVFTTDFLNKLSTVAEIAGVMIFNKSKQPNPVNAHIDVALINEKPTYINYGLNIAFDDSTDIPSTMRWYTRKFPSVEKRIQMTAGNTPHINFTIAELSLAAEHTIDEFVTLVRTDVPHTVSCGNGRRTCVSIRFKENHDWETATNLFNNAFNQEGCFATPLPL